eukprot:GFUD01051560.1.p1 GENE.GFUD01051560.1~~GFUD01051560.1.p1  ORF type:complete len:427 (+),score=119.16 GFUD01051560.1:113-1393(+)
MSNYHKCNMHDEDTSDTSVDGETVPAITKLKVTLKTIEATIENSDDHEIEEPVSPPACDPEDGPPLICFQSIEEIAREVVDENRAFNDIQCKEKKNSSQKNMVDAENCFKSNGFGEIIKSTNKLPSLIPATVSEAAEDLQTSPHKPPPTLHMSGGMVSTDMTLQLASHGIGERDGSILQYFTPLHGDGAEPDTQTKTTKMNNKSSLFTSTNPSHICPNLPLDLSLSRKTAEVSLTGRGKRQREELPDEGKMICTTKKYFDGSRTKSNEKKEKKSFDILQKGKELSQVNQDQDQLFSKRNNLLNDSQGVNQRAKETINLGEEWEVTRENALLEMSKTKMDEIGCRLILPRNKEDKARIVFASGLYVEIDREVFRNMEQKILGEKPEYQKNQSKSARKTASDSKSIRKKEAISRKRSKKTKKYCFCTK